MGRCVHKNIQKFILFQLTVNVAAVIVNFVADLVMNLSSLFQDHHHTLRCSKKKALIIIQWFKNTNVTNRIHETKRHFDDVEPTARHEIFRFVT